MADGEGNGALQLFHLVTVVLGCLQRRAVVNGEVVDVAARLGREGRALGVELHAAFDFRASHPAVHSSYGFSLTSLRRLPYEPCTGRRTAIRTLYKLPYLHADVILG